MNASKLSFICYHALSGSYFSIKVPTLEYMQNVKPSK